MMYRTKKFHALLRIEKFLLRIGQGMVYSCLSAWDIARVGLHDEESGKWRQPDGDLLEATAFWMRLPYPPDTRNGQQRDQLRLPIRVRFREN
jgi:hypothetical protein